MGLERVMGLLREPSKDGGNEEGFVFMEMDGSSTFFDSASDVSEDFSTATSDGEPGPQDLVVVGRGLLASSSASSIPSGTEELMPVGAIASDTETEQETGEAFSPLHQRPVEQPQTPSWWNHADVTSVKGLEESPQLTMLLDVRVIKTEKPPRVPAPWESDQSSELYTAMGMVDPNKCYVAVWLNLGAASLLFVLELADSQWMQTCSEDKFLSQRLKFISNPVRMRGALPSKSPKDAEAVGAFFGKRNTSSSHGMTDMGVPYVCIQVDVFSKWYVKVAFQQVALRLGNILELLLVDGPSVSVLAGCRLTMTPELLELLAA